MDATRRGPTSWYGAASRGRSRRCTRNICGLPFGLVIAVTLFVSVARGAIIVWDGGSASKDRWSDKKNWNPNDDLLNDGTPDLVFTGGIRLTPDADGAWNINSISFDSVASAFVIGGDAITLQGSAVTFGIANDSSNTQTINNALIVGGAQTWTANTAALALGGTIGLGANTLTVTGAADTNSTGIISGTGSIVKTGTGTLTLTGANTYSGGTTVSAGTLQGTTSGLTGAIVNNAAVVFDQTTAGVYAGAMSGTGSFTKQNTGTVTLAGVNTFTGPATVSGGTLALAGTNALADNVAVTIAAGATMQLTTVAETVGSIAGAGSVNLGAVTLTSGGNDASTTFSGAILGTGGLIKTGTGTLTLNGANTYSGGTTINAGTLQGSSTSLQGNIANASALVFDQSTTGTYAGVISGSGSFTKQNSGLLTLSGANTFTGATTIAGGTLSLGAANALADTTAVTIAAGGTFQLAAASETVGSIAGAGGVDLGAFTLSSGGTNASTALSGVIGGSGGIVKTGTGTLTLTGANTYTGLTTISGTSSTLQIGDGGTTGSVVGDIAVNTATASVVFNRSDNLTYAGVVSGSGALAKAGAGTLTLTGANTYTGGTTISAGTLQGTTTSLQGAISNNAALVFDQSTTGTYGGVISGSGSLTKQNTGTVVLSGLNTYSGGTTVSGGTLQGTTASLQGAIVNNASVVFDQSIDGTYAGAMSGSGSLTKQSSGTVTLSGANTYSGGTTITGGALQGTTTSLQGNIANNAALVFDQTSSGTFAGVISGTGSLTKQNTGTVILSGANTYSGGTTVAAGTLQGTTTSLQGSITNTGALVFDQATTGTYAGVISGTGAVTKQNTGTVILSGANTYSGATTVAGGTLALGANNAISGTSNVTLNATTTLDLAGKSVQVATFAYNTAVIDFGVTAAANSFLFTGAGASTGTLTINNFNAAGGDILAFQSGAAGVTGGFLNGVYFYGIGGGVLGATNQTIVGYGGFWDFISPDTTAFKTWDGGGGNTNWTTGANWDADVAPTSGFGVKVAFDGNAGTSPVLDASHDISTLRFNSGAGAFSVTATGGSGLTFGGSVPGIIQLSANAQSLNVPLVLNTTVVVETTGAGALTLGGVVSGTGGINKVGDNTLILSGANTYAGTTTVNAGTVILRDSSALGSVSGGTIVNAGATLQLENNISVGAEALTLHGNLTNASGVNSYGGAISGSGTLNVNGGTLSLDGIGANTYSGTTTVNSGTLNLAKSAGTTAVAGNLVIGNGAGAATVQLGASEQIANAAAVTMTSGGTPVFNLNGQTETIGSLASTNTSAAVQLGTGGLLATGGNNASTLFAGVISGAGALSKEGTGTFTLSGANTYSGLTTVSAGTLTVQNSAALGSAAGGTTVSSGATLQLENNVSINGEALTLDGLLRSASGTNSFSGAISGTGAVTLATGTLTLDGSAANTFSGTTTVAAGTLDLNKTAGQNGVSGDLVIGSGAGAATVRLLANNQISDTAAVTLATGGTPVFNVNGRTETIGSLASANAAAAVQLGTGGALVTGGNNASTTFAGVISEAGALTKQGAGTLTLTGPNTYTGGTTVSGGTLQGNTTSLQGAILNNAAVVFDQSAAGTFAGTMSGSGSLTKLNTGVLMLTGANTYGGGTTVNGGTLQGTTTSLQGNIANNAAVVLNQTTSGSYAGVMSGSGSLTKQNTGTIILSGANTYSGGTTVSGGTLQGTTTSLQGNIVNNAAVVFDQTTSGTFAGTMSGTGSLTKQNTGTVILAGANTYSGGTTVSAGTLQGTTASLQGNIANSGSVVFDQTSTGTYSGVISGSGALTKNNTGTVTLSGANTYTGATTINGGTLKLGASNVIADASSVTLGYGSTLNLGGTFSDRVNVLTFDNATIDFGTSGTANNFLFTSAGANTGTLTINNWTSGTDIFGSATNVISQSFLDNLFFSGINVGIGAVVSSTVTSIPGYGNFYAITPIPTFIWNGGESNGPVAAQDDWARGDNWAGGIAPAVGAVKAIVMAGPVKTTNDMSGAFQINSLLFRSDAGAFTINSSTGDTLTINGGGINNQSANTQTLNVAIALGANQSWTADSGNLVMTAGILNSSYTLTVTGNANTTISGAITGGSGGIVKNGPGVLTLSGANTFTGGVTLNGGIVSIGSDGNLGAASGGLSFSGGTLRTSAGVTSARAVALGAGGGTVDTNGFNSTLSGIISGTGAFTKSGAGTLTLLGANTYSGGTTLGAGTLQGNTTSLQGGIVNNGALVFDQATAGTFASVISGTGSVTKQNAGTLTLSAANTYAGGTTVTAGALQGTTTSLQGNIVNNATVVFDQGSNGIYAGVMSGSGALTKQNSGTLTLSGANTYSGATTVTAGTVVLQNSTALGSTAGGTTVSSGATLQLENGITVGAEALALDGTLRSASGANSFAGAISGTGAVTVDAGTLTLAGSAANTYSGATTVNGGTLDLNKTAGQNAVGGTLTIGNGSGSATVRLLASNQISDTSAVTLAGGGAPVLNLNGFAETVGSVASTNAAAALQLGAGGSLTTGGDNSSTSFAGVISGAGSLVKAGAGTFTLSGPNTYSGGTTVSSGTLAGNTTSLQGAIVNNAAVSFTQTSDGIYAGAMSGSGTLTKLGSATLTLTGGNSFTGATLVSAGTLRLGASNTLAATTALTISSGATFDVNGVTQTIGALAGAGTVTVGGGALKVGNGNVSSTFAGNIGGAGIVEKIGSGVLTFNASFSFAGELKLTGGTVNLAGINLTVGTLRISGNTVLDFGNSVASVLTATNVIIENGAVLTINNWVNAQDYFYATGAFYGFNTTTLATTPAAFDIRGVAPQNQVAFTGFGAPSTGWLPYDHQITPAPEPATYGAMLMSLISSLFCYMRWRASRNSGCPLRS